MLDDLDKVVSIVFILFGLLIVMAIIFLGIGLYGEFGQECNFRSNSILSSVNSIEDIDTGLFSSGTINEKTLLFEDGLVASFKLHQLKGIELMLGSWYRIDKCSNNGGRVWYKIEKLNDALGEKEE